MCTRRSCTAWLIRIPQGPGLVGSGWSLKRRTGSGANRLQLSLCSIHPLNENENMIWNAHFVMPFHQIRASFVAGQIQDSLVEGHMWVPTDDENCMVYNWMYAFGDKALAAEKMAAIEHVRGRGEQEQTADFRKIRNKDNDWLIDRRVQKFETFTGIDGINTQDHAITESMGPIVDRTQEHLGSTDRAVVIGRHLLIQAANKVRQGADPMGLQPSYYNIRALGKILPAGIRWQEALKTELFPDGGMKPARNPVASNSV